MSQSETSKDHKHPFPLLPPVIDAAVEYAVDAWQRAVLTADVMRQRGNEYQRHMSKQAPNVLSMKAELVFDGRELERPVNYMLTRIVPPKSKPIDPKEELRILDYGQRLISHKRNTFYNTLNGDSGFFGFNEALLSGRKAMGNSNPEYFGIGQAFNAHVIDENNPLIAVSAPEKVISTYVYACDATANIGTIVNGDWVVKYNNHVEINAIKANFTKTLKELKIRF